MTDAMFDLPSTRDVKHFEISRAYGKTQPQQTQQQLARSLSLR